MARRIYTLSLLYLLRHSRGIHLEDVPYRSAILKSRFVFPFLPPHVIEAVKASTMQRDRPKDGKKCTYCGQPIPVANLASALVHCPPAMVTAVDLRRFPAGSRIIKIDPGMPIPKNAVLLPFAFDENYDPSEYGPKYVALAQKQGVFPLPPAYTMEGPKGAEYHQNDLACDENTNLPAWEKRCADAGSAKRVSFKYDPLRPNEKNPYSSTGFFPSDLTDASSNEAKVPSSSHTFNTEAESVSVTEYSSDSGIQIQLTAEK